MTLWIAQLHMSRGSNVIETKEIDEMTVQKTYKWGLKTRKKIESVVGSATAKAFTRAYSFFGLHIVTDEQKKAIQEVAHEVDANLKEIEPSLEAWVSFIPIEEERIKQDKVYEIVILNMKEQIYKEMTKRLEKVANRELNDRMKTALLKFVDKLKEINVMGDIEIAERLDKIKEEITKERIPELKAELEAQAVSLDQRMQAFVKEFG